MAQREELEQIVRRPTEDHGVARRANAILLLDDGWSCARVSKALYLDDDTVRTWHKRYISGGWDELELFDWKGGFSRLSAGQEGELSAWLDERIRGDTNEVRAHIRRRYGVWFSHSGCIKLLHRLGFEYARPKGLPAVADEAAQRAFIERYEALQRTLPEDEIIYFADAVHPEHQSRPAHGWIRKGSNAAIKRSSGRKRMNIHGALCLENFDAPFVERERIDADSTLALLKRLEARNPDKKVIHVVLDNAPYHKAAKVREYVSRKGCRINIIWLPAYAPHLNSIERLWGVMHKYVTHNSFYPTFKAFADAILAFFTKTIPKEWQNFRDTVTDNFRVISHENFRVLA